MIKRPINPRFNAAVLDGRKFTTIRDKPWPVGQPIMLYNWTGKPYRSKQQDVAAIVVQGFWTIQIEHWSDGAMVYSHGMENGKALYETEGFESQEEMDAWFLEVVPCGKCAVLSLMRFRLADKSRAAESVKMEAPLSLQIRLEREDGIPAFGAFLKCEAQHDESPVILLNVQCCMAPMVECESGKQQEMTREDRKRLIITTLMHEFGHAMESHFRLPVNEEHIEAACMEWEAAYAANLKVCRPLERNGENAE